MRALGSLIAAVAAIAIAILMVAMGAHHTFSLGGGAMYYGIAFALGVGGVFVIPVAWSKLSGHE